MINPISNEQRAMSNCDARKSTRALKMLPLLIAHCALLVALGNAQGAKLCQKYIPNTQGKTYAWGDNTWAVGAGCGNIQKPGSPYTFCDSFTAIGVVQHYGTICSCLMLWPYVGVIGMAYTAAAECYSIERARSCGFHITGENIENYNGLKEPSTGNIP
ncbi:MAG: hypothetical protein LBL46_04475 [Rickettsiales bacterium]|jgi:hypothetical protein|nr:hypothetical protein [Rickettsiales bacterium]